MTDLSNRKDVEDRLWKEIEKGRFGMLGLFDVRPPQHFQPMTAFCEHENGEIWFFTRDETDLAKAVAAGSAQAMMTFQSKDQDVQACLGGRLSIRRDPERIDRYWNPMVAAWYPHGKDDPRLTMLCLELESAAVWLSEAGPIKYAFEIAKANASHRQPDLGGRTEIRFS